MFISRFYFTKTIVGLTIGDNYQSGSHQSFFDGLLSHFHCVDGLALTPNYLVKQTQLQVNGKLVVIKVQ